MNEIDSIESDKKNLNKIKQMLDYLYEIKMLNFILGDELFFHLFNEIYEKYMIDIDPENSYSDDSEEVIDIKSNLIEQFGENYILAFKDGEYITLSLSIIEDGMKYWDISKIKTNDLETAKKIAFILECLDNIESIRMSEKEEDQNEE